MPKLTTVLLTAVITTAAIAPAVAHAGFKTQPTAATTPYRPYDGI